MYSSQMKIPNCTYIQRLHLSNISMMGRFFAFSKHDKCEGTWKACAAGLNPSLCQKKHSQRWGSWSSRTRLQDAEVCCGNLRKTKATRTQLFTFSSRWHVLLQHRDVALFRVLLFFLFESVWMFAFSIICFVLTPMELAAGITRLPHNRVQQRGLVL